MTRNGKARERTVVTGAGALEVRAPRVNDRRTDEQGERVRFASDILPPYALKSPKVSQVLPLLYLHGLSSGDFRAVAIHAGHHDVEDHEIRKLGKGDLHGLGAVTGEEGLIALELEVDLQEPKDVFVVVADQDALLRGHQ